MKAFRRSASALSAKIVSRILSFQQRKPIRMAPVDLKLVRFSFSQFGEDLFLVHQLDLAARKTPGFYVDVGCFDPVYYSNTRLLHMSGWRGVNIDASPVVIEKFKKSRPDDLNILAAISSAPSEFEYVEYDFAQCNRLARVGEDTASHRGARALRSTRVKSDSLDGILASLGHSETRIDYLNIDCEGLDEEVLRGGVRAVSRTDVITIEAHTVEQQERIRTFLNAAGFGLMCRLGPTSVFRAIGATAMDPLATQDAGAETPHFSVPRTE